MYNVLLSYKNYSFSMLLKKLNYEILTHWFNMAAKKAKIVWIRLNNKCYDQHKFLLV